MLAQVLARNAALHAGGAEMQRGLLAVERAATDQSKDLSEQVIPKCINIAHLGQLNLQ